MFFLKMRAIGPKNGLYRLKEDGRRRKQAIGSENEGDGLKTKPID
jgi:hypothetical protein